jgi:hypothetical protein
MLVGTQCPAIDYCYTSLGALGQINVLIRIMKPNDSNAIAAL